MDRWMCQYSFRGLTVHTDISPSVIYVLCIAFHFRDECLVLITKTTLNKCAAGKLCKYVSVA